MGRIGLLIAVILAVLAIVLGYGIYSSVVDDAGGFIDQNRDQLEEKEKGIDDTNWPTRCTETCLEERAEKALSL